MVLVEIESLYNRYISSTVIEYNNLLCETKERARDNERPSVRVVFEITMNKYTNRV